MTLDTDEPSRTSRADLASPSLSKPAGMTLTLDHLPASESRAVALDVRLRGWDQSTLHSEAGSVAGLVQMLSHRADYWKRAQSGRFPKVRGVIAKVLGPFFRPQVQYNLIVAAQLGRIEASLDEIRGRLDRLAASAETPE